MTNFNDKLQTLLKTDSRFVDQEGDLLKNEIIDKAFKIDENLIGLLITDEETKSKFFSEIKKCRVFNINKFVDYIQDKNFLNDSYTKYKNKIGLNIGGKFLKERNEVSLVRPYKDCVLEGGQDKEDQKRKEIFFNEILAQDEIDRLLDPKVLTNWKKYTKDGEQVVEKLNRDTDGTIKENLIIKGNNLLALHSLKREFSGKVRLIYIDPPYNTGNDGFRYNDNFNHSTWLTFMKNRLEIAKELLRSDGFITIQCDDYEQAYLKVLMDDVFGRDNFRNSIYWHRTYAGKTVSKNLPWNVDIIHLYSKRDTTLINNTTTELTEKDIQSFNKDDQDGRGKYNTVSLQKTGGPGPLTTYDYIDNNGKVWKCPIKGRRMRKEKLKALEDDNRLYINKETMREKYYLNERMSIGKQIDNFWGDVGNLNRGSDSPYEIAGQKPEKLIERIIEMSTDEDNIILDYHIGSGTTCAVAHKMGRQYIGIEQMDYIETFVVERLKKVIEGDQSGISKAVNRQGGGDFIYCELKKYNQDFIDSIQESKDTKGLLKIWEDMKSKSFLNYNVDITKQDESIEEFKQLSLDQQKEVLVGLLDKNQLYVNLSEINDKNFKVSDEDKKLNNLFYNL